MDDGNFDDAEEVLVQLKKTLGEENSEFRKMAGVVEDAKMIWEI